MICPICGTNLPDTANMCFNCRVMFNAASDDQGKKEGASNAGNTGNSSKSGFQLKKEGPAKLISVANADEGVKKEEPSQPEVQMINPASRFSPPLYQQNTQNGKNNKPIRQPKVKSKSPLKKVVGFIIAIAIVGAGLEGIQKSKKTDENLSVSKSGSGVNVGEAVENDYGAKSGDTNDGATAAEVTVSDMVIYDKNNIKITINGLEDSWSGTKLKMNIENNSDRTITIQSRDANVNGYMVMTYMSADIAPGKKANDGMTLSTTGLKESGIEEIATIEFKLKIFDAETWDDIDMSDTITVKTSIADTYVQKDDDSGNVIVDYEGIRIIEKGLSSDDSIWGPGVILYIENNSDKDITVQVRDTSINGYMVSSIISEEVLVGKKSITNLQFFQKDMEENGIDKINDVEFYFHIFEWDTFDDIYDSDVITLKY